jgi:hypothetical protein
MSEWRTLAAEEINILTEKGCTAQDWGQVEVGNGFDPQRVRNAHFGGKVRIGALEGEVEMAGGVKMAAEIVDATLINCTLGDNVRIVRIGSHVANYDIGDGVVITDVGTLATNPGATFGNGVELETINEGGGREVRIFAEMSSQFAYLYGMHRYRTKLIERLEAIVEAYTAAAQSDRGRIDAGATISHSGEIIDVNIGAQATISGAARLHNGTILSEQGAPARIGAGVMAEDFIVGEGSSVEDGVFLSCVFVGQGVQLGKQFSAENSLFFANCEGFHGEACSIFAGPYTVTHHKSTLLIAGIYSFYNAGSGTNQSNHMYKLGPVHQGGVLRGSKTGSFSYMLWPSLLGPFSVVIGKHLNNFDSGDLPFSYITDEGGESFLTPAMNMSTVGTVRDGEKWPTRDRRHAAVKRDLIRFEVYSPYLVGRMAKGEAALQQLSDSVSREVEQVRYNGVIIKRLLLRTGVKAYRNAIDLYLRDRIVKRTAAALEEGDEALRQVLAEPEDSIYSEEWADLAGLLIGRVRLDGICAAIESGEIATPDAFQIAFQEVWEKYEADEWTWVRHIFHSRTGQSVDGLTAAELTELKAQRDKAAATSIKKVLADAEKEFDQTATISYGADGNDDDREADFKAVRGDLESNSFVEQMRQRLDAAGQ